MKPTLMRLTLQRLTPPKLPPLIYSDAKFSGCGKYRYTLDRIWDYDKPRLHACMLNPSTADASVNDPTVYRQMMRAHMLGYGSLVVTNALAWRDTDPNNLYGVADPIGPYNDAWIGNSIRASDITVVGWGTHLDHVAPGRSKSISDTAADEGKALFCLGVNQDGSPKHPLYIGYSTPLTPYSVPRL